MTTKKEKVAFLNNLLSGKEKLSSMLIKREVFYHKAGIYTNRHTGKQFTEQEFAAQPKTGNITIIRFKNFSIR